MKRTFGIWGVVSGCLLLALSPTAKAQDAQGGVLSAVPGDAWAVLCVRNLNELDQKLMGAAQQLNVPPMSGLQMIKATLGLMSGVNDNGGAAIFIMPLEDFGDPTQGMAAILPCADFAALTSTMQPEPAGEGLDGISLVRLGGEPSYIAQHGSYAVVAPTPAAIQKVLAAKDAPGMGRSWTKHQLERFAKDDVSLWINVDGVVSSPAFQTGVMPMLAMMSAGAFNPQELMDYRGLGVSIRIEKDGVHLGFISVVKEGSAAAQLLATTQPTDQTLLTGLPAENFLVVFGMRGSKEGWAKVAEGVEQIFNNPMVAMQLQAEPEKLNHIEQSIGNLIRASREVSFSIASLPAGPDGMIGFAKVVTVESGAPTQCAAVGELIGAVLAMVPASEAEMVQKVVKFTPDAENIGGVSVNHLAINLDQVEGMDPDDLAKVKKVLGSEGVLVRMAALDDTHLAASMGGGAARMQSVIDLVKSGASPLSANESIRKVAAALPALRVAEGYLALDQLLRTLVEIGKAVDAPADIPFAIPQVNAPLALVAGPVGEGVFQADVAIPMELIVAAKDAVASMSGSAPAGPADTSGQSQPADEASGTGGE